MGENVVGFIKFETVKDVKKFVEFISNFPDEYYLVSDRYRIDAKSIMGIFSLDLSKPIQIISTNKDISSFIEELKKQNFKIGVNE